MKDIALALLQTDENNYSLAALVGALETDSYFNDLNIRLIKEYENPETVLVSLLNQFREVIVGFSFMTDNADQIAELTQKLRSKIKSNHITFIAGGPHPTGEIGGTLKMGFDFVVVGEAEVTFPELLRRIFENRSVNGLNGIAYKENEEIIYTGPPQPIVLDQFPPYAEKHEMFSAIEISRGCPWACKFCQTPTIFGRRMRHRSVESIVKYAEILVKNGWSDLRFTCPNALAYGSTNGIKPNLMKLEELLSSLQGIEGEKRIFFGSFPSEVRPECVNEETMAILARYVSNDNIVIGAQSGSQRVLNHIARGHKVEDVFKAVETVKSAGFKPIVDFIFGLPDETEEDVTLTIEAMRKLVDMGAYINSHTFTPLPGTPFQNSPPGILHQNYFIEIYRITKMSRLYPGECLEDYF